MGNDLRNKDLLEIKNIISKNSILLKNKVEKLSKVEQKEKQRDEIWAKIYQVERISRTHNFTSKVPGKESKAKGR